MGTNETFCLQWNEFESNISAAFREIREEKDLLDCTLSCGSRQIQAHKLILSACSPFFRSILKQNPHQHPLLYLKGVEFIHLQAVLTFMYNGEVNIAQEDLNSFLSVAKDLEVKGLTENISGSSKPERPGNSGLEDLSPPPSHSTLQSSNEDEEVQELLPEVKIELNHYQPQLLQSGDHYLGGGGNVAALESQVASVEESYAEGELFDLGDHEVNVEDASKGPSSFVHRFDSGYRCGFCGKEFRDQSNCRRHVKGMHFEQNKKRRRNLMW